MSGFNLSEWALKHRTLVLYIIIITALLGLYSYNQLGQSEDPPFTFKAMVVRTLWPGATAEQVSREVTERIEKALMNTGEYEFISAFERSPRGWTLGRLGWRLRYVRPCYRRRQRLKRRFYYRWRQRRPGISDQPYAVGGPGIGVFT